MANSEIIGAPLKATDKFCFGKYKGMTVSHVLSFDCQYILWLNKNKIKNFDDKIIKFAIQNEYRQHIAKIDARNELYEHSSGYMDADWAAEVGCDDGCNVWGL